MSRVLEVVLKVAAGLVGCGFLALLAATTVRGCIKENRRWKEEGMGTKCKRLTVNLGQPLEVEYRATPETKEYAAGVEVQRVFAYSGAVRVEVTELVSACGHLHQIGRLCETAEGIGPSIPF